MSDKIQTGVIASVIALRGYGFLTGHDGTSFFFHIHPMSPAEFAALRVGDEVQFIEVESERGPRARIVR